MLTLIVCALTGALVGYFLTRKSHDKVNVVFAMVFGVMVGMLVALFVIMGLLGKSQPSEYEYKDKTRILCLVDESKVSGQFLGGFLLISGSVGQEEVYKFYVETPGGGKQFNSLSAKNVIVYEEDIKDAYISELRERNAYPRAITRNHLLIPWFLLDATGPLKGRYAIHVPKGTIKTEENFRLDMK